MPTPTGSYRKRIINNVCEVFNICAEHTHARRNFIDALIAQRFKFIGLGASRQTYCKGHVVVKVAYAAGKKYGITVSDQNKVEFENAQKYPEMTPPTFMYLRSKKRPEYVNGSRSSFTDYKDTGFLSVLVTTYATNISSGDMYGKYSEQITQIYQTFRDMHQDNIGRIGRRCVARDSGLKSFAAGR